MDIDFNELAKKAYTEGATREDNDRLWSALYGLKEWHFLIPPGGDPTKPQPFITKLEDKPMILAFTDSNHLVQCAKGNKIYGENDQVMIMSVPIGAINAYLTSFIPYGIHAVWINGGVKDVMGFYAPLDGLTRLYDYLVQSGKVQPTGNSAPSDSVRRTPPNAGNKPEAANKQSAPPPPLGEQIAFSFHQHQHFLASAIVFAELAKVFKDKASIWCALGTTLAKSAGVLVRKPFLEAAAKAFKRCLPLATDTEYQNVCTDWLTNHLAAEAAGVQPMKDEELEPLLQFLDIDPLTIPNAIAAVPAKDQMAVIMGLGDMKTPRFLSVMWTAIQCKWGEEAARSALKRLPAFPYHIDSEEVLDKAAKAPNAENLQPYLRFAIEAIQKQAQAQTPPAANTPPVATDKPEVKAVADSDKKDKKWWQFWK